MSDLLPANATEQEHALADATERASGVSVFVREMWDVDTCPSNMLAWLAWAFSVDSWDVNWTDAQKRSAIKASITIHKYKGTIGAVQEALASLFFDARVREWFAQSPVGDPYTFDVLLAADQVGISQSAMLGLVDVVERTKNLRSHLDDIQVIVTSPAGPYIAACTGIGTELTVAYGGRAVVINEQSLLG